jgi:CheY-like chemotaxis protein
MQPQELPMRVLIIDDNTDVTETLRELLTSDQHSIRTANNPGEAFATLRDFKAEIIFLDLGMPGMNGFEMAEAIRELPQMQSARFIALTGWSGEEDRRKTSEAGFHAHITKPVDLDTIEAVLQ